MTSAPEPKLRLMVVDDEADNLDLLYRTFRRDFQVFQAESALAALQILHQEGEMGIIISDQRMPKMTGTEFLGQAAEQFPDTIRILLTGYTDVEDLVEAINAGKVFKYITKPWKPEDLKTIVMQAADTYRVLKQRTRELNRALRRESIFNAVTTAIRESLDYRSMLQTIVGTLGHTFEANYCLLRPFATDYAGQEDNQYRLLADTFSYTDIADATAPLPVFEDKPELVDMLVSDRCAHLVPAGAEPYTQLMVPLVYQQDALALLVMYRHADADAWSTEEIRLIEGVAEQAALAISQAKLYQRIQQQTEQMRAELAVAQQIQINLLPKEMPVLDEAEIQAFCHAAREVGGDFFETYVHPQGDVWLAVGDVSGKGVPAALLMASAISVLRRELAQEVSPEPDELMRNLNSSLSSDLVSNNCFITMVVARYRPQVQELAYANAGHIYPLVWSRSAIANNIATNAVLEPTYLKTRGVPLGILPIWKASGDRLKLQSGDVLLLTSDGITEATISTGGDRSTVEMLHQSGLWQLLQQQQGKLDLSQVLSYIQTHSTVQEDDQTILSLEVL